MFTDNFDVQVPLDTFTPVKTVTDKINQIESTILHGTYESCNEDTSFENTYFYGTCDPKLARMDNENDAILAYLIAIHRNQKTILNNQKNIINAIRRINTEEKSSKPSQKLINELHKFGFTDITLNAKIDKG